jgi:hypothetical protein
MGWTVVVKVRGTKDDEEIYSPGEMSEEEASRQVEAIREVLGTSSKPEVDWIAVLGKDIISAHKLESTSESGPWYG